MKKKLKTDLEKLMVQAIKDAFHNDVCATPRVMQDGHNLGCPYFNYKKKINFTGLDSIIK